MKRLAFFLMTLLVTVASSAQRTSGHFEFCNVPIDGRMEIFIGRCNAQGFSVLEQTKHTTLLCGSYDKRNCRVLVERLPKEDCVWGLSVILPPCNNWKVLYSLYREYKDSFTKEFGNPIHCTEYFVNDGKGVSDDLKFQYVQRDECFYKSVFENEKGQIDVVIWHDEVNGCYVLISYIDKANSMKQE